MRDLMGLSMGHDGFKFFMMYGGSMDLDFQFFGGFDNVSLFVIDGLDGLGIFDRGSCRGLDGLFGLLLSATSFLVGGDSLLLFFDTFTLALCNQKVT